jgi:hypothetical protein
MAIIRNTEPTCECYWCGGKPQPEFFEDEQFFITPDKRTICETCVEQNDWIVEVPSGKMMHDYCALIQASWGY